jgi:hypothetical protein
LRGSPGARFRARARSRAVVSGPTWAAVSVAIYISIA